MVQFGLFLKDQVSIFFLLLQRHQIGVEIVHFRHFQWLFEEEWVVIFQAIIIRQILLYTLSIFLTQSVHTVFHLACVQVSMCFQFVKTMKASIVQNQQTVFIWVLSCHLLEFVEVLRYHVASEIVIQSFKYLMIRLWFQPQLKLDILLDIFQNIFYFEIQISQIVLVLRFGKGVDKVWN